MASVSDNRDRRDPEALGTAILLMRNNRTDCPTLSAAADLHERLGMRVLDYDPQPVDHPSFYRDELVERALDGDKWAAALLRGESLAEDPID